MLLERKEIFKILQSGYQALHKQHFTEAKIDSEVLLCKAFNISKETLYTLKDLKLKKSQIKLYDKYIKRRLTNEPLAYITNERYFYDLQFYVNKNVLIPRQETEFLVESALQYIKKYKFKNILELCTGSGCISVAICKNSNVDIEAIDVSKRTLNIAIKNAKIHKVNNKINFVLSNMFSKVSNKKFDMILSNPPYVTFNEYKKLEKGLFYEPKKAFVAKNEGLFFYENIAKNAKHFLNNNGIIILELNSNISNKIVELFNRYNYKKLEIIKDFNNLDRVLVLTNG